jgi:hypothetical protein
MEQKNTQYCEGCAKKILSEWKGWPHKQVVPTLPEMLEGTCPVCGRLNSLAAERITWFNYHGEYNTGLPDYWLLEIDGERKKWGHPYHGECACSQCGTSAVLSEMRFPNGKQEFKCNCSKCGVVRAARK